MHRRLRIIGRRASLILPALVGLACTWMPTLPVRLEATPIQLEALGPGTVFESIDAAAVDALIYAYGQACTAREAGRMRGGAIRRVAGGFSYGPIRVAGPQLPHQLTYALEPEDVARFHTYPGGRGRSANRVAERPSLQDRRSVRFVDPLRRPLYILHPSLVIRVYEGEGDELVEVADLRQSPHLLRIAQR